MVSASKSTFSPSFQALLREQESGELTQAEVTVENQVWFCSLYYVGMNSDLAEK